MLYFVVRVPVNILNLKMEIYKSLHIRELFIDIKVYISVTISPIHIHAQFNCLLYHKKAFIHLLCFGKTA